MSIFHRDKSARSADIKVSAHGDRRTLEGLYLELCELAKQNGLKVEWWLTKSKPDDRADF